MAKLLPWFQASLAGFPQSLQSFWPLHRLDHFYACSGGRRRPCTDWLGPGSSGPIVEARGRDAIDWLWVAAGVRACGVVGEGVPRRAHGYAHARNAVFPGLA